jgi:hypothetical protein
MLTIELLVPKWLIVVFICRILVSSEHRKYHAAEQANRMLVVALEACNKIF